MHPVAHLPQDPTTAAGHLPEHSRIGQDQIYAEHQHQKRRQPKPQPPRRAHQKQQHHDQFHHRHQPDQYQRHLAGKHLHQHRLPSHTIIHQLAQGRIAQQRHKNRSHQLQPPLTPTIQSKTKKYIHLKTRHIAVSRTILASRKFPGNSGPTSYCKIVEARHVQSVLTLGT